MAAFNIITGLIMLVKDKGRDIAVLRTMGATKGMIMRIFFMDGAFIEDMFQTNVFSPMMLSTLLIKKKRLLKQLAIIFLSSISAKSCSKIGE